MKKLRNWLLIKLITLAFTIVLLLIVVIYLFFLF
jgi:hypothetical protein